MSTYLKTLVAAIMAVVFANGIGCKTETPTQPPGNTGSTVSILSSVSANPKQIGVGGSTRVVAVVVDENAHPVSGKLITFRASAGTISAADTTDAIGIAEAIFVAPLAAGVYTVFAKFGDQTDSTTVTVDGRITQNFQIVAKDRTLLADGLSTTELTISAWDTDQQPIADARINLECSNGLITPFVITNNAGAATATLQSAASKTDLISTVRATLGEAESFAQIVFRGIQFKLEALPLTLVADGRSTSRVRAIVKESTSLVAVSGAEIHFGASLGTIPNSVLSDPSGVAEALLTSSTNTGVSTIVASYGEFIHDTVRVTMGQSVPTYLSLSANPTILVADSRSEAEIKAVVSDAANNPVPDGIVVSFTIAKGSGTIESSRATQSGVAISTLTSARKPDSVWVSAEVAGLRDTVLVRYIVGYAATVAVVSDSTSLPADGITTTEIRAYVHDAVGNPVVDGTLVNFAASFGDITPSSETKGGIARAKFSSSITGLAVITASTNSISATVTVRLRSGAPNSILLSYDPNALGVKDSGRNTTLAVTADVRDAKNNPVADGTYVAFSIVASPGGGEFLSTTLPVPTLNGKAQVSLNAGIRAGTVRIRAEVTDANGQPYTPVVSAVSTDVIIFAGPPYIIDINDRSTSRVSVGASVVNIFGWGVVNDTTTIVTVVGDKYNNPVPAGTAVYFTTTGGIVSTATGYTDREGVARVTLHSAQPYPTVPLYYSTFNDPNENNPDFTLPTAVIPGPIPDFEGGVVDNGYDGTSQNNGIARVLAVSEGVDANGKSARVWDVCNVVFSGLITTFYLDVSATELSPGEAAIIGITVYDVNGNPIIPGSHISVNAEAGKLSWSDLETGDPGKVYYSVSLVNNLDPTDPDAKETSVSVGIRIDSRNGTEILSTPAIRLKLD